MVDRRTPSRRVDEPSPGFFTIREIKGGPAIPARIARGPDGWWAYIAGKLCGAPRQDPVFATGVMKIWHSGKATSPAEYYQLLAAMRSDPSHPAHKPHTRIDLGAMAPVF